MKKQRYSNLVSIFLIIYNLTLILGILYLIGWKNWSMWSLLIPALFGVCLYNDSEEQMEKNIITQESILQTQVCSIESWDNCLEWLRQNHPAGTSNNWQKDERECVKPVKCKDHPDRTHYIFVC